MLTRGHSLSRRQKQAAKNQLDAILSGQSETVTPEIDAAIRKAAREITLRLSHPRASAQPPYAKEALHHALGLFLEGRLSLDEAGQLMTLAPKESNPLDLEDHLYNVLPPEVLQRDIARAVPPKWSAYRTLQRNWILNIEDILQLTKGELARLVGESRAEDIRKLVEQQGWHLSRRGSPGLHLPPHDRWINLPSGRYVRLSRLSKTRAQWASSHRDYIQVDDAGRALGKEGIKNLQQLVDTPTDELRRILPPESRDFILKDLQELRQRLG